MGWLSLTLLQQVCTCSPCGRFLSLLLSAFQTFVLFLTYTGCLTFSFSPLCRCQKAFFRHTFLIYRLHVLDLIALSYADVNTVQKHRWNNSCLTPPLSAVTTSLTPPLLIVSNQLYLLNMKTRPLQGRLGHFASHAKELVGSWQEATAAKQETASSLSSCYRWMVVLTDRRNKLAGISRTDKLTFQGFSFFCSCSFSVKVHFYSNAERMRDRWQAARVLLRWFNAKHLHVSVVCVYKDCPLHNWAVVWVQSWCAPRTKFGMKWMFRIKLWAKKAWLCINIIIWLLTHSSH